MQKGMQPVRCKDGQLTYDSWGRWIAVHGKDDFHKIDDYRVAGTSADNYTNGWGIISYFTFSNIPENLHLPCLTSCLWLYMDVNAYLSICQKISARKSLKLNSRNFIRDGVCCRGREDRRGEEYKEELLPFLSEERASVRISFIL